jgi:hypothetical protein
MSELLAAVTGRVKIRGFVLDHASGQPVAGVAVALWAEVDEGVERPVGVLTSDGAGYVSFDTRPLPSRPIAYLLKSGTSRRSRFLRERWPTTARRSSPTRRRARGEAGRSTPDRAVG